MNENNFFQKRSIIICSKDRITGSSISNAQYFLPGFNQVYQVQLGNFSLLNLINQVTSANNTFTITETGGGTATITIPVGTYDYVAFATTLQNLLNSAGLTNTYTVTISPTNFLLNITGSSLPFSLSWPVPLPNQPGAYYLMGFGDVLPAPTTPTTHLISPYGVNLINVNKIGISLVNTSIPTLGWSSSKTNFNFVVDNFVGYGDQLIYRPFTIFENTVASATPFALGGHITIQLYDLYTGNLLDTNGVDYQLQFIIEVQC